MFCYCTVVLQCCLNLHVHECSRPTVFGFWILFDHFEISVESKMLVHHFLWWLSFALLPLHVKEVSMVSKTSF